MRNVITKGLLAVAFALTTGIASATTCFTPAVVVEENLTTQNVQDLKNLEAAVKEKGGVIKGANVSGPDFSSSRSIGVSAQSKGVARAVPVGASQLDGATEHRVRFLYQTDGACFIFADALTKGAIGVSAGAIALGLLAAGAIAAAAGGGGGGGGTTGTTP